MINLKPSTQIYQSRILLYSEGGQSQRKERIVTSVRLFAGSTYSRYQCPSACHEKGLPVARPQLAPWTARTNRKSQFAARTEASTVASAKCKCLTAGKFFILLFLLASSSSSSSSSSFYSLLSRKIR